MDGAEREAAAVVGGADWGLSRPELNTWPRGTSTQRAVAVETHFGLRKKEDDKKEREEHINSKSVLSAPKSERINGCW